MLELGERAGVEIGEVYEVDASRRSTALNAYVSGLGPTKRVVLYDTLLDELQPRRRCARSSPTSSPTSSTVDIPRGMLWVAIVAPLGLLFAGMLATRPGAPHGRRPRHAGGAAGIRARARRDRRSSLTIVSNQLSRDVEARGR